MSASSILLMIGVVGLLVLARKVGQFPLSQLECIFSTHLGAVVLHVHVILCHLLLLVLPSRLGNRLFLGLMFLRCPILRLMRMPGAVKSVLANDRSPQAVFYGFIFCALCAWAWSFAGVVL